jgi:hypothetical protein
MVGLEPAAASRRILEATRSLVKLNVDLQKAGVVIEDMMYPIGDFADLFLELEQIDTEDDDISDFSYDTINRYLYGEIEYDTFLETLRSGIIEIATRGG